MVPRRTIAMRMTGLVAATLLLGVALIAVQLASFQSRVALGQDADWGVKGWSTKHARSVMQNAVDKTTVKGIWHAPNQAWAGIDDILPTGGRFGYEEAHGMNANEAKLRGFMKHARKELRSLEAHVPKNLPQGERKAAAKAMALIKGDEAALGKITKEFPMHGTRATRARPQMLAAQAAKAAKAQQAVAPKVAAPAAGRVYVDEAMYGEGIVGDIKSEGHKARAWSKKAADANMDAYYHSLAVRPNLKQAAQWGASLSSSNSNPKVEGSNANFANYFKTLDAEAVQKTRAHNKRLERDGYFKNHPEEVPH
mmetsp:Transcript_7955/g.19338  ORF Transcript_7955/g.19338 Transcript_7955/m.19338 type:complete len:310 (+) Transcript_7955:27-956(+)